MSTHEQKKYYKKKRRQLKRRKELIKKYSIISLVLIAITLAIVLPTTLIEKNPNKNNNYNTSGSSARYTLMDLGSKGCIPCDNLQPVLDSLRATYKDKINVVFYDVNNSVTGARLGNEYNVTTIPTLIYLDNNKEVYRSVGYKSQSEIEADFRRLGWI